MSWEDHIDCDCCDDYMERYGEEEDDPEADEESLIDIALFNYECKVYNETHRQVWR